MITRAKPRSKPRELTEEEKLAKEKERIRKLQITLQEQEGKPYRLSPDGSKALLDALIREHPERDPAKIK
jgi:hypothetical protein